LREELKLGVFENRVLRRIFEPRRDTVTGARRKPPKEELNDLYSSPNIVWVIKRRVIWAGHVAPMGDRRGVYRVLMGKLEGERPLGRPRRRWGIIFRGIFRKWDVGVWPGSSWLRIGTGGGLL
jgi:hypothetical protein